MNTIIFNNELRDKVIKRALKKELNDEENIIDKLSGQEVLNPEGNIEDFGGFENGSEIFIENFVKDNGLF